MTVQVNHFIGSKLNAQNSKDSAKCLELKAQSKKFKIKKLKKEAFLLQSQSSHIIEK
jgi:hypothetical protein